MRQRYHPFSLRYPRSPGTGSLGQSLHRPLTLLPHEENVSTILKQRPHVGARTFLGPPAPSHRPGAFNARNCDTASHTRRTLRCVAGSDEVGGRSAQGPPMIHTHIVEGTRCANDPHAHRLVKERRRRLVNAPLPRPLARTKERFAAPSGHHNTAARIVSALHPRNQESIWPRHTLDAHRAPPAGRTR